MPKIELVYFEGCPNVERAREAIRSSGVVDFSEVNQNHLAANDPYLRFSSPTILTNGQILFGSVNYAAACSMINWSEVSSKILSIK